MRLNEHELRVFDSVSSFNGIYARDKQPDSVLKAFKELEEKKVTKDDQQVLLFAILADSALKSPRTSFENLQPVYNAFFQVNGPPSMLFFSTFAHKILNNSAFGITRRNEMVNLAKFLFDQALYHYEPSVGLIKEYFKYFSSCGSHELSIQAINELPKEKQDLQMIRQSANVMFHQEKYTATLACWKLLEKGANPPNIYFIAHVSAMRLKKYELAVAIYESMIENQQYFPTFLDSEKNYHGSTFAAKKSGLRMYKYTSLSALRAYRILKRFDGLQKVVEMMKNRSMIDSTVTALIIQTFIDRLKVSKSNDKKLYTSLHNELQKIVENTVETRTSIKKHGYNAILCATILRAHLEITPKDQLTFAFNSMLEILKNEKIEFNIFIAYPFLKWMTGLNYQIEEMIKFLEKNHLEINSNVYNLIIPLLIDAKRYNEAFDLWNEIKSSKGQANLISHSVLLGVLKLYSITSNYEQGVAQVKEAMETLKMNSHPTIDFWIAKLEFHSKNKTLFPAALRKTLLESEFDVELPDPLFKSTVQALKAQRQSRS